MSPDFSETNQSIDLTEKILCGEFVFNLGAGNSYVHNLNILLVTEMDKIAEL